MSPTSSWPRPWPNRWDMQVISLADIVIPPQVLAYVTEPMAQLYRIVPVSFRDNTLDGRHVRSAEAVHPGRAADFPGL